MAPLFLGFSGASGLPLCWRSDRIRRRGDHRLDGRKSLTPTNTAFPPALSVGGQVERRKAGRAPAWASLCGTDLLLPFSSVDCSCYEGTDSRGPRVSGAFSSSYLILMCRDVVRHPGLRRAIAACSDRPAGMSPGSGGRRNDELPFYRASWSPPVASCRRPGTSAPRRFSSAGRGTSAQRGASHTCGIG